MFYKTRFAYSAERVLLLSTPFSLKGEAKMETKTRNITLCAVMIALATVLSMIPIYNAPFGGTVTLGSMVPLVLVCVMIKDYRWSRLACFTYSLIQMLIGFTAPPTTTLLYFVAVVLLDYVIPFTGIFVVNPISKLFKNELVGIGVGAAVAMVRRFICHFLSGILIWGVYAPEGQPVWLYSVLYNGGYMLPELVITTVASTVIYGVIRKR